MALVAANNYGAAIYRPLVPKGKKVVKEGGREGGREGTREGGREGGSGVVYFVVNPLILFFPPFVPP